MDRLAVARVRKGIHLEIFKPLKHFLVGFRRDAIEGWLIVVQDGNREPFKRIRLMLSYW